MDPLLLMRPAGFVGVLAAMLLLERFFSFVPSEQAKRARIGFHIPLAVANTAILYLVVAWPMFAALRHGEVTGLGLRRLLGLSGWVEIVATVVVFDLWDYCMHLANHKVRFLWRFHKAHHTDMEIDVTTSARFHIGELVISGGAKCLMILLWGPSLAALLVFDVALTAASQFHHSNLNIPTGAWAGIERLIVTPRMHRCHHSLHRSCFNHNFSTIFSVWDPLFGSYHRAIRVEDLVPIGLYRPRGPETMRLGAFLRTPLGRD